MIRGCDNLDVPGFLVFQRISSNISVSFQDV